MPEGPTRIAVRARISGRVQGVWFRAWTVEQAEMLGLDGWVRNRSDGSVEALFAGPRAALVDSVMTKEVALSDDLRAGTGFRTQPTA